MLLNSFNLQSTCLQDGTEYWLPLQDPDAVDLLERKEIRTMIKQQGEVLPHAKQHNTAQQITHLQERFWADFLNIVYFRKGLKNGF